MKKKIIVILGILVLSVTAASWAQSRPKCYSQRNCQGKVIATCDAEECERQGGKSWSNEEGVCYADMGD